MTKSEERRKPPFASGKIVPDYEPLFAYWEEARKEGREDLVEKAMLSESDYNGLQETARHGESLVDLWDRLTVRMTDRIDADVAAKAYGKLGMPMTREDAREDIARILAGWLIEAGEYWRMIRLRSREEASGGSNPGGEGGDKR